MSSPRLCIATSFDGGFSEVGVYAAAAIELYAQRWGFDTHIDSQLQMDRPPAWHRVKLIPELFERGYDFVFWIDADAVIVDPTRNILDEVEDGKDLYIVQHTTPEFPTSKVPNTGVTLARNCAWTVSFYESLWDMVDYENHPWWENAAAIKLMGYLNLLGEGEFAPNAEVLAHVKFLNEAWNHLPGISTPGDHIVAHYAGGSRERRTAEMPRDLMRTLQATFPEPTEELASEAAEVAEPRGVLGRLRNLLGDR